MDDIIYAAEQASLFCRLNINAKRELPIRSSEMGLLIYLCKAEGDKTPMGAARFFKVSKAMVTNMVTSLLKKGYLEKSAAPSDRRSVLLHPTEKAEQLVENTYQEYVKSILALQQEMGEADFKTLVALLEKANNILLEGKSNG